MTTATSTQQPLGTLGKSGLAIFLCDHTRKARHAEILLEQHLKRLRRKGPFAAPTEADEASFSGYLEVDLAACRLLRYVLDKGGLLFVGSPVALLAAKDLMKAEQA